MIEVNKSSLENSTVRGVLFLLLGAVFSFIFGHLYYKEVDKKNFYNEVVTAEKRDSNCLIDKDGNSSCSPIYYFEVDGTMYTCKSLDSSSSDFSDLMKVYYHRDDPERCITEFDFKSDNISLILFAISLFVVFVSVLILIKDFFLSRKIKRLIRKGTLFKGLDYDIKNSDVTMSGSSKVVPIIAVPVPNGEPIQIIGNPVYVDKFSKTNKTVDVLIELDHPSNYYVDHEIRISGEVPNTIIDLRTDKKGLPTETESEKVEKRIHELMKENNINKDTNNK